MAPDSGSRLARIILAAVFLQWSVICVNADCTTCTGCPAGQFSALQSDLTYLCTDCGADTITAVFGKKTVCAACPNGKSTLGLTGQSQCRQSCGPGQYFENESFQTCLPCPVGTAKSGYSFGGLSSCIECEAFTPTGTALCPCPSNLYKPVFGDGANFLPCSACPTNSVKSGINYATTCTSCGSFVNVGPSDTRCPCPAGSYREYDDSSACTQCPVNTFIAAQNTFIRFSPATGGVDMAPCQSCPYGTNTRGQTGRSKCIVNVPTLENPLALSCPAGQFRIRNPTNLYGMPESFVGSYCALCPEDTSQPTTNAQFSCLPTCATRTYIETGYGSTITRCPCLPGAYLNAAQDKCYVCPPGTYIPTINTESECIDCPDGYTTFSLSGASKCRLKPVFVSYFRFGEVKCPAGYYGFESGGALSDFVNSPTILAPLMTGLLIEGDERGGLAETDIIELSDLSSESSSGAPSKLQMVCFACQEGSAKTETSDTLFEHCTACEAGVVVPEGTALCPCPPGKRKTTSGTEGCVPCPVDTFAPVQHFATTCTACPNGRHTYIQGARFCLELCTPGSYFNPSRIRCEFCPAGQDSVADASTCFVCSNGMTSAGNGTRCYSCPAGTVVSATTGLCEPCPPGRAASGLTCTGCPTGRSSLRGGECTIFCAAGTYSSASTEHLCKACNRTYTSLPESGTCFRCTEGRYLASGGICTNCPVGTFAPRPNVLSACALCPQGGGTTLTTGGTRCVCLPGTYGDGSSSCLSCPAGRFAQGYDAFACTTCLPGQSSFLGASSCFACSAGTFANVSATATGQGSCQQCRAGKYAFAGSASCQNCTNFQSSNQGDGQCYNCPSGSTSKAGEPFCRQCNPGRFAPTAASDCFACPSGRFSAGTGSSQCDPCPSGFVETRAESTACSACQAGSYAATPTQSCVACAIGTFSSASARTICFLCVDGSTTNRTGQTQCFNCAIGRTSTNGQPCTNCPAGQTTVVAGSTACTPCAAGTSSTGQGGTCINCAAGKSSASPGDLCSNCDPGRSANTAGSLCTACDAGKYAVGKGDICAQCPSGKVASNAGTSACSSCASGLTSDVAGVNCVQCPVQQFPRPGASCTVCEAGHESIAGNGGTCTPCAIGKASSTPGAPCSICPSCTSTTAPGATSCTACPPYYETRTVSGPCMRCVNDICNEACGTGTDTCSSLNPCGFSTLNVGCTYDGTTWRSCSGSSGKTCTNSNNATAAPLGYMCECAAPLSTGTYPTCSLVTRPCDSGTYSATGITPCTPCPFGQTTLAPSGAISINNCTCPAGNFLSNSSSPTDKRCVTCPVGTYSAAANTPDACTTCSSNSTTLAMASAAEACVCLPGHRSSDGTTGQAPCVECTVGRFSSTLGQSSCTACATGYTNPSVLGGNTTARLACTECAAGYVDFTDPDTEALICVLNVCVTNNGGCDSRTSCTMTMQGQQCGACPSDLFVGNGTTGCACPSGYYAPNGTGSLSCAACSGGRNYTNSTNQATRCHACPIGYEANSFDAGTACVDTNECQDGNNGGCSLTEFSVSTCNNTIGGRICGPCAPGFEGTGYGNCIDPCTLLDQDHPFNGGCDNRTTCLNQGQGQFCSNCPEGYLGAGITSCEPLNLCTYSAAAAGCDPLASCVYESPGVRSCTACPYGYTGTGETQCEPEPCLFDNGGCDTLTVCNKTVVHDTLVVNRTCGACPRGYFGDGYSGCVRGFCLEGPNGNGGCDPLAACTSLGNAAPGQTNYSCSVCPAGYTGTGDILRDGHTLGSCDNVNECQNGNNGDCGGSLCIDTPGGRTCSRECYPGFTRQQHILADTGESPGLWTIDTEHPEDGPELVVRLLINGETPATLGALAVHPDTRVVYGATAFVSDSTEGRRFDLVRVNLTTGVVTAIGPFVGVEMTDMSFEPATGDLYGLGHPEQTWNSPLTIYLIDTDTGRAMPYGDPFDFSDDQGGSITFQPLIVVDADSRLFASTLPSNGGFRILELDWDENPGAVIQSTLLFTESLDIDLASDEYRMTAWTMDLTQNLVIGVMQQRFAGLSYLISIRPDTGELMILSRDLPLGTSAIALNLICADVNECVNHNNGGCSTTPGSFSNCTNTPGNRTCAPCATGFTGTGIGNCVDIDECLVSHGGCDSLVTCTNTPGSRICGVCPYGYFGTGTLGDPCVQGACGDGDNGGCDERAVCASVNASTPAICGNCPRGFAEIGGTQPNQQSCRDIDECSVTTAIATAQSLGRNLSIAAGTLFNGGCERLVACINDIGAYQCGYCTGGSNRHLYAAQGQDTQGGLWELDIDVGTSRYIGPVLLEGRFPVAVGAMAVHPFYQTLYAVTTSLSPNNQSDFVRINKITGYAQFIGSLGVSDIFDLSFTPEGRLVGAGMVVVTTRLYIGLYEINLGTGAATLIEGTTRISYGFDGLTYLPLSSAPDPTAVRKWAVRVSENRTMLLSELSKETGQVVSSRKLMPPLPETFVIMSATADKNQTSILAALVDTDRPRDIYLVRIDVERATFVNVTTLPRSTNALALDTECRDVNECLSRNGGCSMSPGRGWSNCTNTPGSRTCSPCASGFTGTGIGNCTDIDECVTNHGGCDPKVTCTNTHGGRICGPCPTGHSGTGSSSCIEINECLEPSKRLRCSAVDGLCANVVGTFVCAGQTSPARRRRLLANVNSADGLVTDPSLTWPPSVCTPESLETLPCTPALPLFVCDSLPCNPADHPGQVLAFADPCIGVECTDPETVCQSLQYFTIDGINTKILPANSTSNDIQLNIQAFCAPPNATDIVTSKATCLPGYDIANNCTDSNECDSDNGGCDSHTECINRAGAFECGPCPDGFTGTGETECIEMPGSSSSTAGGPSESTDDALSTSVIVMIAVGCAFVILLVRAIVKSLLCSPRSRGYSLTTSQEGEAFASP